MTTDEMLNETVESARSREAVAFDALARLAEGRIVLFGAGSLGRKIAGVMRRHSYIPVVFADNDRRLWGQTCDGVSVVSPEVAAQRWRDQALFVVTMFHPTAGGLAARVAELETLGCRWVTSFLPLAWKLATLDRCSPSLPTALPHYGAELPSRLVARAGELRRVASLWADPSSQEIFRQQLGWRLRGDFTAVDAPARHQYFPPDVVRPRHDEVFVDGGAFDGDTLRSIPWPFLRAWAIEPDPATARKLRALNLDRVDVYEAALGRERGSVRFNAAGTMASARSATGEVEVQVVTLDALLAQAKPTFLKLDVEGDELAALQGARATLSRCRPVVAVCVYHRPEDLWSLPLLLKELLPDHRFFLRIHAWDGFELVAYAVPAERLV